MSNTSNRPRGLGNFNNMSNATGREASQPMPTYTQDNIWSNFSANRGSPPFQTSARQTPASSRQPTLSSAAPGADASGRFAAQASSSPWGQVPARTTSDNVLPNKPRHGHTASSSFLEGASMGARGRAFPSFSSKDYHDEEKENSGFAPASFSQNVGGTYIGHERRSSHAQNLQSFSGLGAVGAPPSRDGSVPPSRQSDGSSHHSSPPGISAAYTMPSTTYATRRPDPLNPSASERHRPQPSFDMTSHVAAPVNPFPRSDRGPLVNLMAHIPNANPSSNNTRMYTDVGNASYAPQPSFMPNLAAIQQYMYYNMQTPMPLPGGLPTGPGLEGLMDAATWAYAYQQNGHLNNPYQPQQHQQQRYHQQPAHAQDMDRGSMSQVLLDFRNSKGGPRWDLKSIYGHIVEFSGDQQGSRHIQKALETANSEEKEIVFKEVLPNAVQMMKDLFGNYVIQKLFEHGNMAQKRVLASQMQGKVADLSNQMYACRVVQKAFQHVLVEQQEILVRELAPNALQTIQDPNGNHVIQKVLESVDPSLTGFLYEAVSGHVVKLSNQTFGCRVIQRMLEFGNAEQKEGVLKEIMPAANSIMTDIFGNYVAQHVIKHANDHYRAEMIRIVLRGNVFALSRHKNASNIVEECIINGTAADRTAILKQLTDPAHDPNPLLTLMKDQYANYVLQKMLEELDMGPERQKLIDDMRVHFPALKASLTGRQASSLERLIAATEGTKSPRRSRSRSGRAKNTSRRSSELRVDVNSSTPTPVLTTEQNSPQSSSPPSTNSSALGDSGVAGVSADGNKGFMRALRGLSLQDNEEDVGADNLVADRY